jgi:hypothetical protein
MNRIKTLFLCLALVLVGSVYAAGSTRATQQTNNPLTANCCAAHDAQREPSSAQAPTADKCDGDCCAKGAVCCSSGGSCCKAKIAKR